MFPCKESVKLTLMFFKRIRKQRILVGRYYMGHFVCAFCVRKFFKVLNSASADLQYENLKLASSVQSISSSILSLKEIQSDREE